MFFFEEINDETDSVRVPTLVSPAASRMLLNILQILGKRFLSISRL